MNLISMNPAGRCDGHVDALRSELGDVLAERILEAEAADFLWDSRVQERYLGQHIDGLGDETEKFAEVSRVAILSFLDRRWYAAICLVDGDGMSLDLHWKLRFTSRDEAEFVFAHAR